MCAGARRRAALTTWNAKYARRVAASVSSSDRLQPLEQRRVLDVDASRRRRRRARPGSRRGQARARSAPRGRSGCACGRCRAAPPRASAARRAGSRRRARPPPLAGARRALASCAAMCSTYAARSSFAAGVSSKYDSRSGSPSPACESHSRLRSVSSWSAVTPQPNSTKIPARCSAAQVLALRRPRAAAAIGSIPAASIASRSMPAAYASPSSRSSRRPASAAARSSNSRSTTSLRRLTSSNEPHAP